MKILLVQPSLNWIAPPPEVASRALLILGTIAKEAGHEVKIIHRHNGEPAIDEGWVPDILGITCNTFQVHDARNIAKNATQWWPECKVVVGGPHAIAWDGPGMGVIGPGEASWREILGAEPSPEEPKIDYSLVDISKFYGVHPIGSWPGAAVMASRGCPNKCIFCNTPLFWGKKVQYRQPQNVVDEIAELHSIYGINEIFFQDDTFNLNHKWACEIFQRLIDTGLSAEMSFKLAGRVNEKLLTPDFLELAYRAGVWNIFYGIESGSQKMLDRMKKGITVEEAKRAIALTKEANIQVQCSFILGLPGETRHTIRDTLMFIKETEPHSYGWVPACPFPGTELDKQVTIKGHKLNVDYAEYGYGKLMCRTDELDYPYLEEVLSHREFG